MIAEEGKAGRKVGEKWSAKMVPSGVLRAQPAGDPRCPKHTITGNRGYFASLYPKFNANHICRQVEAQDTDKGALASMRSRTVRVCTRFHFPLRILL